MSATRSPTSSPVKRDMSRTSSSRLLPEAAHRISNASIRAPGDPAAWSVFWVSRNRSWYVIATADPLSVVFVSVSGDGHQASSPLCSGRTSVSASMATSSMESSGSKVVKFCIHIPGADSTRVSALSCRPTARLIS